MPMDANGNRADVVMDDSSVISRMNLGRFYEHYFASAARDATISTKALLPFKTERVSKVKISNLDQQTFENAYNHLMGFYAIVSSRQYDFFNNQITLEEKYEHLSDVYNEGIYIYYPIENEKNIVETIKQIQKHYTPTYGPITYVGNSKKRVTTVDNVRIAPLYMVLLEKIADDWSSVASGKLQHFGILSPVIKSEKFSYPFRNSPVRTIGETEGRLFAGYCGRQPIAEMMDRSNNPMTQRNVMWKILTSDKPTNIETLIDRKQNKFGSSKPLQLVKHIFKTAGFKPVYEPEDK